MSSKRKPQKSPVAAPSAGISPRSAVACLVAAGLLVFGNSLNGVFLFDDHTSILMNPHLLHVFPISESMSGPRDTAVAGRPVVSLSLALNYAAKGLDGRSYHAGNIAIHILSSLVLFGLVRRTLERAPLCERFEGKTVAMACAATLLWLIHPLQTEVVNYVTQRSESMMGLFYLLTLYASLRAWDRTHSTRWTCAAIACCALGMGTKESMVTAPIAVVVFDLSFAAGGRRTILRARRFLYAGLFATWSILAILMTSVPRGGSVGFGGSVGALQYALNQCVMIAHYLRLSLWPAPLVLDYGTPVIITLREAAPYVVLVSCVVATVILAFRRSPPLGFLGAWFLTTLAPTSSFVPIVTEVGAERRMYLPLAALAVFAVIAVTLFEQRSGGAGIRTRFPWTAVLLLATATALGSVSIARNAVYRDEATMWRSVTAARPHWRAHTNLARALLMDGKLDETIVESREAIRENPAAAEALFNLAEALKRKGAYQEATQRLGEYLVLKPDDSTGYVNLGDLLIAQGQFERAADAYSSYLNAVPQSAAVHNSLGLALASSGDVKTASVHFRRAIELDPGFANAHYNLAKALVMLGQPEAAEPHLQEAMRLNPEIKPQ